MKPLGLALDNRIILHKVLQELLEEGFHDVRRVNRAWYETSLLLEVRLTVTRPDKLGEFLLRFPNSISVACRRPSESRQDPDFSPPSPATYISEAGLDILASCTQLQCLELDCLDEKLTEIVQVCLAQLTNLESLSLTNLSPGLSSKIFPVLEGLPLLHSLTWKAPKSGPIQTQPLRLSQLESLNITQNCILNKSSQLLFPCLTHLTCLVIEGNRDSKEAPNRKSLLQQLEPYYQTLKSLSLMSSKQNHLVLDGESFLTGFLELESLKLKNVISRSTDCALFDRISSLPNLCSLHLEDVKICTQDLSLSVSSFEKLTSLAIGNILDQSGRAFDLDAFFRMSIPVMNLTKLSILKEVRLPSDCVFLSCLMELSLSFVSVDRLVLHEALKSLAKVKCLSLKCSMYVSSKSLKRLKDLNTFKLICSSVDQDLPRTLGQLSSLLNLTLRKCYNFYDSYLEELSFVSQLRSLTLYDLPNSTCVGYKKLGDGKLVNLRYLGLHQHGLVDNELWELRAKLPSLKTLHTLQ